MQPATTNAQAPHSKSKIDACALLTSKEIESVQGEPLKETKSSGSSAGQFAVSQCYFALPTSGNSISLTVMQKGDGSDARDPKEWWKQTFERAHDKEKGREEEEGKAAAPQKIDAVADEAFWIANRVGGELYVLKGNSFIRIGVGEAADADRTCWDAAALFYANQLRGDSGAMDDAGKVQNHLMAAGRGGRA